MVVPEESRGACFGCGFVGKRLRQHSQVLLEATSDERAKGDLWMGNHQMADPWCVKERPDFISETRAIMDASAANPTGPYAETAKATVSLLLRNRNCPDWFPYSPFNDPAQHVRDQRTMNMEEQRRRWQMDLEESNRRWAAELEQDRREFEERLHQEGVDREERESRVHFWFAIAAISLAVAEVAGVVVALAFSEGWLGL